MNLKNWVKSIQTAGYNDAHTVFNIMYASEDIFLIHRKVASSRPSPIEAHAGLFRLLMNGIFDPYVL